MENSYTATASVYDYVVEYRCRPDVSFFVQQAVQSAGTVLELGCGTGRVLIPTATPVCPLLDWMLPRKC